MARDEPGAFSTTNVLCDLFFLPALTSARRAVLFHAEVNVLITRCGLMLHFKNETYMKSVTIGKKQERMHLK